MIFINVASLWPCVQLSWAGTRSEPRLGTVRPGGALHMYWGVTTLVSKYRLAVELWVIDRVQLHWAEYRVKNASDWQVFRLGLLLKEVGTGILCMVNPGCVIRLKTFVGKVAHLSRV